MRKGKGKLVPASWNQGEEILTRTLEDLVRKGRGERIVFIGELMNGSLRDLASRWLSEMGSGNSCSTSPWLMSPSQATRSFFDVKAPRSGSIGRISFIYPFGAGFEYSISNLEFAQQFAAFPFPAGNSENSLLFVGPSFP